MVNAGRGTCKLDNMAVSHYIKDLLFEIKAIYVKEVNIMKCRLLFAIVFLLTAVFSLCAAEQPILKVGICTDTHVNPDPASCEWVQKAWEFFKKHKVDLVANCGDIADKHYPEGYRNYRNVIKKLFPAGTAKPKELYVYANHDRVGMSSIDEAFAALKKHLQIPNEPYDTLNLKGYTFLVVPQTVDPERYEKMIVEALKAAPGKPLFIFDHVPAVGTTRNSFNWGSVIRRQLLNKYPQVIHITGHTHNTPFNEQCIWQGEFTSINAGTLYFWRGSLAGSVPEVKKRGSETIIMEVYKEKIIFRRYSLLDGSEYRPENPWCIPWPFKKETAPYNIKRRYERSVEPAFPAGAKLTFVPDGVPFNQVKLQFPAASPDAFIYNIAIEKKNNLNKFEPFTEKEIFANFHLRPAEQLKTVETTLASGYFDSGREYRITVTPENFCGKKGRPVSCVWRAPATAVNEVLFESKNPMKEMPFKSDLKDGKFFKQENGFYLHDAFEGRLLFPDKIWNLTPGTPLRLIADIHTIQNGDRNWTIVMRNPAPRRNANIRVAVGAGKIRCRYIIDFFYQQKDFKYYLLLREGNPGKVRFNYIRIEKLPKKEEAVK